MRQSAGTKRHAWPRLGSPRSGESHVVGVVGRLAVPSVEVDGDRRGAGTGSEADTELRERAPRARGPRARVGRAGAAHAEVDVGTVDPGPQLVRPSGLYGDHLLAPGVVGSGCRATKRSGAA